MSRILSAFLMVLASGLAGGEADSAQELYKRFCTTYGSESFARFRASFLRKYASPKDGGSTEIVQHFTLNSQDDLYHIVKEHSEGQEAYSMRCSWNGSIAVRFDQLNGFEGNVLAFIGDEPNPDVGSQVFQTIVSSVQPFTVRAAYDTHQFDARSKTLDLSVAGGPVRERIVFDDPGKLTYQRIEFYDMEQVLQKTYHVKEWREFGGRFLPSKSELRDGAGELIASYELDSFSSQIDADASDFVLEVPYEERIYIFDERIQEYLNVTDIDETMWKDKDYLDAFAEAFSKTVARELSKEKFDELLDSDESPDPTGVAIDNESPGASAPVDAPQTSSVSQADFGQKTLGILLLGVPAFVALSCLFLLKNRRRA